MVDILPINEALTIAEDEGLDLVLFAPTAKPPVCKLINYSKFKYDISRQQKENKKKQKAVDTKEVQLSMNIAENDLNVKANAARRFIEKGHKVQISLRFRGREITHSDAGMKVMDNFYGKIADIVSVDKPMRLEGRNLIMKVSPKN